MYASDASVYKNSSNNKALWITYINIILYALCYQLQRPVEPFLVGKLEENSSSVTKTYGRLQSFFSTIQTIGSPVVGLLLDRVGIRWSSAAVFTASAVSYFILAYATDLNTLFFSKIPTVIQHAFLVAQAVAATSGRDDEAIRAQALGRMTTAYTIGATIGPALGGILAEQGDYYIGAKLAVAGSLLSVVLSLCFLPNIRSETGMASRVQASPFLASDHLLRLSAMATRSILWPLLAVKVLSGVASSMYQTTLPMVLTQDERMNFDPAALGLSMSISMFASALFGAFGMAPITHALSAIGLARCALLVRPALILLLAAIVSQSMQLPFSLQTQIIGASMLQGLASHTLATAMTTQTTGAVSTDEQGTLLGLEHGLFSMARIAGPALGTAMLSSQGFGGVAVSCGVIDLSLLGLLILTSSRVALATQKRKGR